MIYAAFSDFSSFDFGVADPGGRRTRGRCPGEPWRSWRCAPRLTETLASNISFISLVSFSECDYVDSIE
jgi:hypothetical protein